MRCLREERSQDWHPRLADEMSASRALDMRVLRVTLLCYIWMGVLDLFRMRIVLPLLGICIY